MGKKKRWKGFLFFVGSMALFFYLGLRTDLTVRRYTLETGKLTAPIRVVFLSDLHSCKHGEGQRELIDLVRAQEPDLVLLGGDWVDNDFDRRPPELAYTVAQALAEEYPTFYVSGNHEVWSGRSDDLKEALRGLGVDVLEGEGRTLEIRGQTLHLWGIDDPDLGEELWEGQLAAGKEALLPDQLELLLSHRPERVDRYAGFDVVFSGHAHGGQWRIPLLLNGLYAPNQGFFPKYTGGYYPMEGGGIMVVGRGLSRETTRVPRFYDPPEVVVVDLE